MEGTDEFGRALELTEPDDRSRWLLLAVAGGLAIAGVVLYAITKRQLTERATAIAAPTYPDGWEASLTHAVDAWDTRWANMAEELEELRARVNGNGAQPPATDEAPAAVGSTLPSSSPAANGNAGQMPAPELEAQPSAPPTPAAVSMQPGAE